MADKKISALTAATTPLAGTEVLPIVQSGATVKVANNDLRPKQIQSNATSGVLQVSGPSASTTRIMTTPDANFTVARTDSANSFTGDQTLVTGNAIFSGAAKGITGSSSFSITLANGASGTLVDLATALPAGGSGLVNVAGAIAGKTIILVQRDQGGYYTATELGTQPRGTYITSISLSGTNLQITNSTGGSETFSGKVVVFTA